MFNSLAKMVIEDRKCFGVVQLFVSEQSDAFLKDRERLLVELEHMQQTDLLRRRQQVSQMPPQIFQPLYKRQETREDFQREMEFAFEDMYTGERSKGYCVLHLV